MSGAGALPPIGQVSEGHVGPYVVVAAYILLVWNILLVLVRIVMRYLVGKKWKSDDYLIIFASILAITQTILVDLSTRDGLGSHEDSLTADQITRYQKYHFASQILQVVVDFCAKASLLILISLIASSKTVALANKAVAAGITLWLVASIFSLCLQCGTSQPYNFSPGRCVNQTALYATLGALSIILDVCIVVLSAFMLRKVQVAKSKRYAVTALFAPRVFFWIALIAQIALTPNYAETNDQTWNDIASSVARQFTINFAILTACIPSIGSFLSNLQTGLSHAKIPDNYETTLSALNSGQDGSKRRSSMPLFSGGSNGKGRSPSSRNAVIESVTRSKDRRDPKDEQGRNNTQNNQYGANNKNNLGGIRVSTAVEVSREEPASPNYHYHDHPQNRRNEQTTHLTESSRDDVILMKGKGPIAGWINERELDGEGRSESSADRE